MTQQLCNEYQYQDREESSPPPTTTHHSSNPPAQNFSQYEQSPHDEATEMLTRILNMSNANETTTHVPANTDDNSDSDVSFWSEDERTILRAFYENEREDGNEQNDEDNDEILLERYIMDLCQNTTSNTAKPLLPPLSLTQQAPQPASPSPSSYASASSSSHS